MFNKFYCEFFKMNYMQVPATVLQISNWGRGRSLTFYCLILLDIWYYKVMVGPMGIQFLSNKYLWVTFSNSISEMDQWNCRIFQNEGLVYYRFITCTKALKIPLSIPYDEIHWISLKQPFFRKMVKIHISPWNRI